MRAHSRMVQSVSESLLGPPILEWYWAILEWPAPCTLFALTMAAIEEHRQCVNEFIAKICKTRNAKILSKQIYNHIVTFLKSGDVLLDKEAKSKLRW